GDFTVFGAQVENLFLPVPIVALEEYGLPRIVAMKLRDQLQPTATSMQRSHGSLRSTRKPCRLSPSNSSCSKTSGSHCLPSRSGLPG
nr:hypothetical protein [Actinomycetota bacterium]